MLSVEEIEQLKSYFKGKDDYGDELPDASEVTDGSSFYLLVSDEYVEHKMFQGIWYKKKVNASDEVVLVEV